MMKDPKGNNAPTVSRPPTRPAPDLGNRREGTAALSVSAMSRWLGRQDLMEKASLALRGLTFLFSLLSFFLMVTNKHGGNKDFDKYEEYRYLLAIAILSLIYTGVQSARQIHQFSTGKLLCPRRTSAIIDFSGDQVMAYLLISSASAAIPLTNNLREGADNVFTDSSAAAITMSFLAFFMLAGSSIISGYHLFTPS